MSDESDFTSVVIVWSQSTCVNIQRCKQASFKREASTFLTSLSKVISVKPLEGDGRQVFPSLVSVKILIPDNFPQLELYLMVDNLPLNYRASEHHSMNVQQFPVEIRPGSCLWQYVLA